MRGIGRKLGVLCACAFVGAVTLSVSPLPGFSQESRPDTYMPPPMVARLEDPGGKSACTAALIAPDLAVTAAHCARPLAPPRPFRPGDAGAAIETRATFRHPIYGNWLTGARRLRFDLALVALAEAVPEARLAPLPIGPPPRMGEVLTLETWRIDDAMPQRRLCPVTWVGDGLAMLDCPVRGGHSGGPVVRMAESGPEIVAVVVARGGDGALATSLAPRIDALVEAAGQD